MAVFCAGALLSGLLIGRLVDDAYAPVSIPILLSNSSGDVVEIPAGPQEFRNTSNVDIAIVGIDSPSCGEEGMLIENPPPNDDFPQTKCETGLILSAGESCYTNYQCTLEEDPDSGCGACVAPDVWKQFDCYNLAAIGKTTNDDPFTPSWRLIGGYWQWGRKGPDSSQWYNTNTSNFAHGPTGPDAGTANSGSIAGWDTTVAPDGSWSDASKTVNDPCPEGYRVPTNTQWEGVVNNNTQSTVGTWATTGDDHTNYSAARFFGNGLMLPAAGDRRSSDGALRYRGYDGYYWSSTQSSTTAAWSLLFYSSDAETYDGYVHSNGYSVRCIAE